MSARHCRRKHWRLWKTKTFISPDGTQNTVTECPHCGVVSQTNPKLH